MAATPSPKPFSIRMSARTLAQLEERAQRRRVPKSRIAEQLIDEGLRMQVHPGVTFRDGPSGRRAALAGGPDVWEVIETLKGTGLTGEKAVDATARWSSLSTAQVRSAVGYYAEYRDEVDERIRLNRQAAERERRSWERMQEALG